MKQFYFFVVLSIISFAVESQTNQQSVRGLHTSSIFNSVKYAAADSSTINAGYIYDSTNTSGRDWFLVKLDKNKNIVWQKIINNAGDDFIYKVIVCKNGDYVAVGVLTQDGIPRGFISRFSSNGSVLWSTITSNTSAGEICYDIVETNTSNLVVASTDQWNGSPNCFIIALNASGKKLWSKISQFAGPDQPYSIGLLPNGNLIIGINEWVGGHYNLILAELKAGNGEVVTQNTYSINATIPNSGLFVNSLAAWGINVSDKQVSLYCYAFQGSSSTSNMCIYKYNTGTKKLDGNIYYHTNDVNTIAFTYAPIGKDDFLISESFANPTQVYVSRITNGYVVYDDLIKGGVTSIKAIDTTSGGAVFAGSIIAKQHDNSYNLFAPQTDPVTNSSCRIINSHTLNLIPSGIDATATSDIIFVAGGTTLKSAVAYTSASYKLTVICGDNNSLNSVAFSKALIKSTKPTLFAASPNPAQAIIHFTLPYSNKISGLSIYNMNGKQVFVTQLNAGVTSKDVNVSNLAPGIYNAELTSNETRLYLKIIKD